MPSYEILIDGEARKIELIKTGENQFSAKIGDKSRSIELKTEKLNFEKAFEIKVDDKTYKIELQKIEQEKPSPIKVDEVKFTTEVRTTRRQAVTTFEPTPQASTRKPIALSRQNHVEGAIIAPMTGKIVSVKVKKGYQVKQNQVLCTIEAMKMENEITTPKAGNVQEVNVSEGSPVNEGDVLFIVA
jgi:biotin carboxyl carrier protein